MCILKMIRKIIEGYDWRSLEFKEELLGYIDDLENSKRNSDKGIDNRAH
jgi:hypothetical protein